MKEYYIYEKSEIWRKSIIIIDDDKDPIEAYKDCDYELVDSELLYDTEELIPPSQNSCQPTQILKDEHDRIILWDNSEDDISLQ